MILLCFRLGRSPVCPKILDQKYFACQLPFHISEIKCYVLRIMKCGFYSELGTSAFYGQFVVSLLKNVSNLDNLPVVSCKYLCLSWSYLGGGVHFAFTWSVVPVIAAVTCTETAVVCLFWLWLGCFVTKISYF